MIRIAYDPIYQHPLPNGPNGEPHRFPMAKYELIPEQLLREGTATEAQFFSPAEIDERWILTTHTAAYWSDLKTGHLSVKMGTENRVSLVGGIGSARENHHAGHHRRLPFCPAPGRGVQRGGWHAPCLP